MYDAARNTKSVPSQNLPLMGRIVIQEPLSSTPFFLPLFETLVEFFLVNNPFWRLHNGLLAFLWHFGWKITTTKPAHDSFGLYDFSAERALSRCS